MYEYQIRRVHRVVDGDTYDLELDLGFYQFGVYRVRILGVDAPEIWGRNASPGGAESAEFVRTWFEDRKDRLLIASTRKADSFGRWLADITCDGESLATAMLIAGQAETYE